MTLLRRMPLLLPLLAAGPALADDLNKPSSGWYGGAHVGYMFGNANATLFDSVGGNSSFTNQISTLIGGIQGGYEHVFPSHWMLGIELDAEFPDYMDGARLLDQRFNPSNNGQEELEFLSTIRGRIGYAFGSWTPYLTGGVAVASLREDFLSQGPGLDAAKPYNLRVGYTFGAGVDKAIDNRWSARFEYLYTALPSQSYLFTPTASYQSSYDFSRFRFAFNYHLGVDGEDPHIAGQAEDDRGPGTWEVHGQTTLIYQGYPAFHSAIPDGPQSLPQVGQAEDTFTGSLFFGVRLWNGGEFYYNPELLQGYGLASTTGLAGFPNGEAQKSNFPFPQYNTSRLFLRQTFGLGGETEKMESDYGQLAGVYDISRITIQVGRYAVHDLFDTNDYAQDPRVDFMNWSIWASGAFDYGADKVGITWGITAELNQKDWAVRAGYFLVGDHPNSNIYDMHLFYAGQYSAELEGRYKLYTHPGVIKVGVFSHNTYAANFNDVANLVNSTGLDVQDATLQMRHFQVLSGYYINLQQEILDDVGFFARWSSNDGQSEYSAFTDISASLSGGLSIKGKRWGRPDDTVGIAGAINYASPAFQNFLAVGGLGILIGDGQLPTYGPEHIVEVYYSLQAMKGVVLTADYQHIDNPAYDAVRGPVDLFAGRLRLSF